MVPYVVGDVVAVTVMHVLLFVLYVCLLRDCWGTRVTTMLVWGPGEVCCGECVYGLYMWFQVFCR